MGSVMFGQMFNEFVLRKGFYNGMPVYKMYVVPVVGVTLGRNDFINTLTECKEAIDKELNKIVKPKNSANKVFSNFNAQPNNIVIDGDLEHFDDEDELDDEALEVMINDIAKGVKQELKKIVVNNAVEHSMIKMLIAEFAKTIENARAGRTRGDDSSDK